MIKNDLPRFCAVMGWLAGKYPTIVNGETVPRSLPEGEWITEYFEALSDISIERIEAGAKWHYGNNKFFPDHPAELRESVMSLPAGPAIEPECLTESTERETPHEEAILRLSEIFNKLNCQLMSDLFRKQ